MLPLKRGILGPAVVLAELKMPVRNCGRRSIRARKSPGPAAPGDPPVQAQTTKP